MRAVFRGISQIIFIDEIKHNLLEVGSEVTSVSRKHKKIKGTKIGLLFILVRLVNRAQNRTNLILTRLGRMLIKVETQKVNTTLSQCHTRSVKCGQQ